MGRPCGPSRQPGRRRIPGCRARGRGDGDGQTASDALVGARVGLGEGPGCVDADSEYTFTEDPLPTATLSPETAGPRMKPGERPVADHRHSPQTASRA